MFNKIKSAMIAIAGVAVLSQAQTSCPHFLLNSAMVVNIEGFFVNEKMSRASLDVEWRHHPDALDTFFVNQPDVPKFNFITAGEYRYMEFPDIKIKRQLGTHHLKEHIGETPLKLDDMELLANGQFLVSGCKMSHHPNTGGLVSERLQNGGCAVSYCRNNPDACDNNVFHNFIPSLFHFFIFSFLHYFFLFFAT
jgi:hypothetical protein